MYLCFVHVCFIRISCLPSQEYAPTSAHRYGQLLMRYYGFLTAATTSKIAFIVGCTQIVIAVVCGTVGSGGCCNTLHQTHQRGVVGVHFFGFCTFFFFFNISTLLWFALRLHFLRTKQKLKQRILYWWPSFVFAIFFTRKFTYFKAVKLNFYSTLFVFRKYINK